MYRIACRFLVPGWSAKPLVSAHDRIMGTHTHPAVLAVLMITSDDNTRDVAAGREDLPAMLPNRALMSPDQR